ncbi:MAG TPA: sortase [Candidatus Saccharimonadales bacterium]|nr:sortase [Candidatus Saccharimonadales bacterium]
MHRPRSTTWRAWRAPLIGITTTVLLLGIFNAQLIVGRSMLAFHKPVMAAAPPTLPQTSATGSQTSPQYTQPELIIPRISVTAPIVTNMPSPLEKDVQKALESGVLLFAGTPAPGNGGNTVILGHSSNTPWAPGSYKFVFMMLDQVQIGDKLYANYQGKQYIYEVTTRKVIRPNDTSVLAQTATPTLTLITCTPVGTSLNRLVIQAKQISPAVDANQVAPEMHTPKAMTLPSGSQNAFQAVKHLF